MKIGDHEISPATMEVMGQFLGVAIISSLAVYGGSNALEIMVKTFPKLLDEAYLPLLSEQAALVVAISLIQGLAIDKARKTERPAVQFGAGPPLTYGAFLFITSMIGVSPDFALSTEAAMWIWISSILASLMFNLKNLELRIDKDALLFMVSILVMMMINLVTNGIVGTK